MTQTKTLLVDTEEEKKRLVSESNQLKEVCRRELEKSEAESVRNTAIIADYKQVTNFILYKTGKMGNGIVANAKLYC